MRALVFLLVAATGALHACSKGTPDATPSANSASTTTPTVASAASSAGSAGSAGASPAAVATWAGKYTSSPGTLTVPDGGEWSHVKWRGDDSKDGLGEGALVLVITGSEVRGTLEGPLGPATVRGAVDGAQVTAWIERTTPSDKGFSGTLLGTIAGTAIEGSMRLSVHDARVIREAKFSLTRATGK